MKRYIWLILFLIVLIFFSVSDSLLSETPVTIDGMSVYYNTQPTYKGVKQVRLVNNESATNPTWEDLMRFLESDATDRDKYIPGVKICAEFADTLHDNAEKAGIRAAWVALDIVGSDTGHALNAFETVDKGLVFIDCTGIGLIESIPLALDQTDMMTVESPPPEHNDKIAYVEIGREYGIVSVGTTSSPEYDAYLEYKQRHKDFIANFEALEAKVEQLGKEQDILMKDTEAYNSLVGGRTVISDPEEYEKLHQMFDELEAIRLELNGQASELEQEWESLQKELDELGTRSFKPLGIVQSIEIYW